MPQLRNLLELRCLLDVALATKRFLTPIIIGCRPLGMGEDNDITN